jgi:hypothetical protein
MNVLQGQFFSTAFRVVDGEGFEADPVIGQMHQYVEFFSGEREGEKLFCITHKDGLPGTTLRVARPAIMGLLADARPSPIPLHDDQGWIAALQHYLDPADGIVLVTRNTDGSEYQTYISTDCAGWTRQA